MDPGYCDEKCLKAVIDADSAAILESCQRESLGSKIGYIYKYVSGGVRKSNVL